MKSHGIQQCKNYKTQATTVSRKYPHKQPNKKIRNAVKLITRQLDKQLKNNIKQHMSAEYGLDAATLESMAQAMVNAFIQKHTKPIESIRFTGILSKDIIMTANVK